MKKQIASLFVIAVLTALLQNPSANAQTLYVPSGTAGIGSSANSNVGIGKSSPAYKLEVNGNIVNSNPSQGWLGLTGDLPGYSAGVYPTLKTNFANIYFSTGGYYTGYIGNGGIFGMFNTSGAYNVQLNASGVSWLNGGNVGIGTISPEAKLHLQNPLGGSGSGRISFDVLQWSNANIGWNSFYQGFNISRSATTSNWTTGTDGSRNGAVAMISSLGGDMSFACIPSSGATAATLTDAQVIANTKLQISGNGNVGIGLSNPASKLDILGGNINIEGNNSSNLWTTSSWRPVITAKMGSVWRTTDALDGKYLGFGMSTYGFYWCASTSTSNSQPVSYPMKLQSVGSGIWQLEICGKLRVTTTGCDFVFADEYKKMPWQEKELYYKTHKRLPYVESAADMESDGLDVGTNFSGLLHNVEEDRLDISELYKRLEKLENENKELKKEILVIKNSK